MHKKAFENLTLLHHGSCPVDVDRTEIFKKYKFPRFSHKRILVEKAENSIGGNLFPRQCDAVECERAKCDE